MSKYISPSFVFDRYPHEMNLSTLYIIIAVFFTLFLIGIIFALLVSRKKTTDKIIQKLYSKISNWGLWSGIIGLFISFLRYQRAPYLGMRFWLMTWLVFNLIWLAFIIKFFIKDVPQLKKERANKKEFEKYLP